MLRFAQLLNVVTVSLKLTLYLNQNTRLVVTHCGTIKLEGLLHLVVRVSHYHSTTIISSPKNLPKMLVLLNVGRPSTEHSMSSGVACN